MSGLRFLISAFILLSTLACSTNKFEVVNYHKKTVIAKAPTIDGSPETINGLEYFLTKYPDTVKTTIIRENKQVHTLSTKSHYIEYDDFGDILVHKMSFDNRPGGVPGEIVSYDYSMNPLIGIYKFYSENGMLACKGIISCFGFQIGKWYTYDAKGILISVIDHDKNFKFDYLKVYKFCNAHDIPLTRNLINGLVFDTTIHKIFDNGKHYWLISYKSKKSGWNNSYTLDGNTGKIVTFLRNDD